MNIMLGNLTVEQIEQRLNLTLKDEHKKELLDTWQQTAAEIKAGKWHWFDVPFVMVCGDKDTAAYWVEIFKTYDLSKAPQFGISWER